MSTPKDRKRLHDVGRSPKSHEVDRTLQHKQCVCGHFAPLHDHDNELTRGECLHPHCDCASYQAQPDVRTKPTTTR